MLLLELLLPLLQRSLLKLRAAAEAAAPAAAFALISSWFMMVSDWFILVSDWFSDWRGRITMMDVWTRDGFSIGRDASESSGAAHRQFQ